MNALQRLIDGNRRYVENNSVSGDFGRGIRQKTASEGQHPFAVIVCCSDSRVIPEAIFDCGLGDLFVVRTAGNTISENELGSVEYAVSHLGCGLVMVLGHTCCGAVSAALSGGAHGHTAAITDIISRNIDGETDPTSASRKNAEAGAKALSEALGIKVLSAVYDIETGEVSLSR